MKRLWDAWGTPWEHIGNTLETPCNPLGNALERLPVGIFATPRGAVANDISKSKNLLV